MCTLLHVLQTVELGMKMDWHLKSTFLELLTTQSTLLYKQYLPIHSYSTLLKALYLPHTAESI